MTASNEPQSFEEAVSQFQEFLRKNGWSTNLIWVEPTDLLLTGSPAIYVRLPVPAENLALAHKRFALGMSNGLGILFDTICELKNASCCFAWVPKNPTEQADHLMGRGLKLSAPADRSRRSGKAVVNRFY